MIQFFRIANFEKYQHYKDRKPPWIKLYRDVLSEPKFFALTDAERYYLMGLFILASQHDNRLPANDEWLKIELKTTKQIPVAKLLQLGWLEWCETDSLPVSIDASKKPIVETETETETEKSREEGEKIYPAHAGKTICPASLPMRVEDWEWAIKHGITVDLEAETEAMIDWAHGKGEKRMDWEATRRNWWRNAQKRNGGSHGHRESEAEGKQRRTREASERILAREAQQAGGSLSH